MLRKDLKKAELDELLEGKGDFVQIDYLNRFLKLFPPIAMRKYAYLRLAKVYLEKRLFEDAAKMFSNAAINSLTFKEKNESYMKEAKCYIKAGKFESSSKALRKAFSEANEKERNEMAREIINYYKKEGESLEKEGKPGAATTLYERLIRMRLPEEEKSEVKEKLLSLYKKLGKIKEYNFLKSLSNW